MCNTSVVLSSLAGDDRGLSDYRRPQIARRNPEVPYDHH
jgi:hypothetical protein